MGKGRVVQFRTVGNVTEKRCPQCGKYKLYTERYYPKSVRNRDWLDVYCRKCFKLNRLLKKLFGTTSKAKLERIGVDWRSYSEEWEGV